MLNKNDPNSLTQYYSLFSGGIEVGYLKADYFVSKYDNVQVQNVDSVVLPNQRQFIVHCTQRIVIYNPDGMNMNPSVIANMYESYPVLINTFMDLSSVGDDNTGIILEMVDYSPKTINTKVQNSTTQGSTIGSANGTSNGYASGSITSQSNNYGASADISGNVSANIDKSDNTGTSSSTTHGSSSSSSSSNDSSSAESMSLKDWGSYGFVNPKNQNPTWIFGQEYPWDVIQCRSFLDAKSITLNGVTTLVGKNNPYPPTTQLQLVIPSEMYLRMYDQVCLYPPSQLSMFGINFVMKAAWLVTLDNNISDELVVSHNINYYTASHSIGVITPANPVAETSEVLGALIYMDPLPITLNGGKTALSININLPIMALKVLGGPGRQAIIGFIPSKFTVKPGLSPYAAFKIISTSNTMMIMDTTSPEPTGGGFTAGETALTASFSTTCITLTITVYFKITDTVNDYRLYLKHWMSKTVGVMLTFVINGDTNNPIIRYVTSPEGEGGDDNLLTISLRDQNFASIEYHDYLQLGLNSIQIAMQPITGGSPADCGYQIRAISIERD